MRLGSPGGIAGPGADLHGLHMRLVRGPRPRELVPHVHELRAARLPGGEDLRSSVAAASHARKIDPATKDTNE